MAQARPLVHSLNSGEVSNATLARVDQEKAKLWAETQENLFPSTIGKASQRPGTTYIGSADDHDNRVREIPFVKSLTAQAGLELSDGLLRVWVDDELVTREAVTSTVGDGDFGSSASWTLSTVGDASSAIANGVLTLAAPARGGIASARQEVTTSDIGEVHPIRVVVTRGPVTFRIGGVEFGDEYLRETELDTGTHSLVFTPTGVSGGTDAFTKLLLHCDGVDASTTFTDSSSSPHTVTANGNAQIDTAQFKFSTASALFDGTSDYLSLDGSSDFAFGTGDFTIEMQVRPSATSGTRVLYSARPAGTTSGEQYPTLAIVDGVLVYTGALISSLFSLVKITGTTILTLNTWHHVAVTRSGTTIRLFLNGVGQGSSTGEGENESYLVGANRPVIGTEGSDPTTNEFSGWIDEVRVSNGIARWTSSFTPPSVAYGGAGNTYWLQFSTRSEAEVIVDSAQIEAAGVVEFAAPWTEDQLREIQYTQSADIVYLAHTSWQQRKIERRGDASWSLVLYKFVDGPFTTVRTAKVRLKPAATRGNTTLTADAAFFRPEHVGTLFRLTHDRFHATFLLGGEESYTDPWRRSGIRESSGDFDDRNFDYTTTGTWVGTVTMQRSLDGPDAGFRQVGYDDSASDADFTVNVGPIAHNGHADDNNIIAWYRLGFEGGDYTSGSILVDINYDGHSGSGLCRVTSYTSTTVVSVEVIEDFKNTFYVEDWQEGEFSDLRGWPAAVAFHDGRLVWVREDKFRASESNNFTAFNLETEGDSVSIQRDIATSGAVFQTNALLSLSRLNILTDGAEVPARSDAFDAPLTATNIALKEADNVGSARRSPVKVGKNGYFIANSGIKLYRLKYNFEQQDYDAEDATELHEGLGEDHDGFEELGVQRHPQPYVWTVMGDGQCGILLTSPKHQVEGWFRFVTDGEVESVAIYPASLENRVYLWVARTINGSTVRYREKLCLRSEARGRSTTKLADCGTFAAGPVTSVTAAHLASETGLVAWGTTGGVSGFIGTLSADGLTGSLSADASGIIALGATYTNVFVGLPYVGKYKSAKLAYGSEGGTALMARKIIEQVGLLMMDVHRDAIRVGPSFDKLIKYIIKGDTGVALTDALAVKATHDQILQPAGGSWSPDARLCVQVNAGHPATIGGIAMDIKTTK